MVKFLTSFLSPPKIHNVDYITTVIKDVIHNDYRYAQIIDLTLKRNPYHFCNRRRELGLYQC
ncbi:DUF4437 domain-containing protein [Ulvibacterium sp.]|uniref:DUF4437 domain-containing protein n=1 Tax=Ulvibacterium sp. TaxID=2665914 RepID=UPI00345DA3EA